MRYQFESFWGLGKGFYNHMLALIFILKHIFLAALLILICSEELS